MKRSRVVFCLATIVAAGVPAVAGAQGFGLNEIGACAIGRGFAVTGSPCADASTIYWNPAAATTLRGVSALLGATSIAVNGGFRTDVTNRNDAGDVPTSVPPHAFVNWKAQDRLALGVGLYVPYGLTSQWKNDFAGRFLAQRASLATIYVQPNVAYDIVPGRLSIGGGPVIGHSSVELKQSLDALSLNPALAAAGVVPGTEIGRARLTGDAMAYGAHIGLYAHLAPTLTVGVRYLTAMDFKYDNATARFTQTTTGFRVPLPAPYPPGSYALLDTLVAHKFLADSALSQQKGSTHIKHPAQLQFGVGFTGLSNTTISLDGDFVQWSSFQQLPIDFSIAPDRTIIEDYNNSWSVRTGIEHRFAMGIAGRAGFSYAQTPAPDETVTPLLPDMNRYNYGFGVGLPLAGRYTLDASYLRVDTQGRRGRIVERTSTTQTAAQLNSGVYSLDANIFSLSLKAQF
ncbi:MAG TPA: outer membrane protein transport protein [Gemmatimonadaceae bacterium]|nr:outer membrane protein transport protein [Gemmatimonadaceae bacterium]